MNFKKISNELLLSKTKELVSDERKATLSVLHYLREVERRRLFAMLGFSSLFEYATKELGYSESSAHRRIASMRLIKELPEIEKKIEDGSLSLSVISHATSVFRQENIEGVAKRIILESLEGKSKRQAEKILAAHSTQPILPERVKAVSQTHSEVRFLANDEVLDDLEKLKNLVAHQHPHASMAELIAIALKMAVRSLDKTENQEKPLPPEKPTRFVGKVLKTFVWKRDQGRCTYVSPVTGRKCNSRHALELDHKIPFSQGGKTSAENLRLLCAQHNRLEAQRLLGDWVDKYAESG